MGLGPMLTQASAELKDCGHFVTNESSEDGNGTTGGQGAAGEGPPEEGGQLSQLLTQILTEPSQHLSLGACIQTPGSSSLARHLSPLSLSFLTWKMGRMYYLPEQADLRIQ